ncbi:hypothetical protein ACFYOT_35280 [Saccharothrix saharensis]
MAGLWRVQGTDASRQVVPAAVRSGCADEPRTGLTGRLRVVARLDEGTTW